MTELLQALLTPLIAITMAYIAYQQYRLRLDERALVVYDRRLAIYKTAVGVLDRVRAGDSLSSTEAFSWLSSMAEAPFLFGEEIQEVIDPLFDAIYKFSVESELAPGSPPRSWSRAEAAIDVEVFRSILMKVFSPYLRPSSSLFASKRLSVAEVKELLRERTLDQRPDSTGDEDIPF